VDAPPWDRENVSDWAVTEVEAIGSTETLWLDDPTGQRWLHKDTVIPANGIEQGEDWSEIISSQVATLLASIRGLGWAGDCGVGAVGTGAGWAG